MSDFIVTWDTYFGERTPDQRERTIRGRLAQKGIILPPAPLALDDSAAPAVPYVNDNRWLVNCPDCGAAHLAREDEIFLCNECGNSRIRKQLRRAPFPKSRRSIEVILLCRPVARTRHWTTETLAQLKKENKEHGDPIPAGGSN